MLHINLQIRITLKKIIHYYYNMIDYHVLNKFTNNIKSRDIMNKQIISSNCDTCTNDNNIVAQLGI